MAAVGQEIALSDLAPDPKNARKHDQRNIEMIQRALEQVGAARSIVIDEHGTILAGNGVVEAAAEAGIERVLVVDADGETLVAVRRTGLTDEEKVKLALYDNRTAELADWDVDVLGALDVDLGELFFESELEELGLDLGEDSAEDPGAQIDKAAELQEKWQTARGQIWQIGKHRLMCGDSTSAEDVGRLMGGEKATFTFTDPPYNVGITYGEATNDSRTKEDFIAWCKKWACHLPATVFLTPGIKRLCWWDAILGDPQWIIAWDKPNGSGQTGLLGPNKWDAVLVYGAKQDQDSDVIRVLNDYYEVKGLHPTGKPVELWAAIIARFADGDALIYDPFLGSGTTMVACENLSRICFGCEIEPKYCAVTLERMVGMGLGPVLTSQ